MNTCPTGAVLSSDDEDCVLLLEMNKNLTLEGRGVALVVHPNEPLTKMNDLRWAVSKKQDARSSTAPFDEELGNESLTSITTTTSLSSTLDEDSPPRIPRRKCIRFADSICVREFDVIVGDDRVCDYPLTLSWNPLCEHIYNMDERQDYLEEKRQHRLWRMQDEAQEQTIRNNSKRDGSSSSKNSALKERCFAWPHRFSPVERRERLRYFGSSNAELAQSQRKRKTRLSMDYAYGYQESMQAQRAFRDQQFRYIV